MLPLRHHGPCITNKVYVLKNILINTFTLILPSPVYESQLVNSILEIMKHSSIDIMESQNMNQINNLLDSQTANYGT